MILDEQNFEKEVLQYAEGPVLVDFFAPWCGPCQMQGPLVEELGNELQGTNMKVAKLDIDANPKWAEKFGVMSIPTLLIFKNGQVVETMVGLQSKDNLKAKLEEYK